MFLPSEIGVFGVEYCGKSVIDEFQALLFQPQLSLYGCRQFELTTLPQNAKVVLRRVKPAATPSVPWCQFWGDCSSVCPSAIRTSEVDSEIEEFPFITSEFQLIKHFPLCRCGDTQGAQVLVCLPNSLRTGFKTVLTEKNCSLRRLLGNLFLVELTVALLERGFTAHRKSTLAKTHRHS